VDCVQISRLGVTALTVRSMVMIEGITQKNRGAPKRGYSVKKKDIVVFQQNLVLEVAGTSVQCSPTSGNPPLGGAKTPAERQGQI
jgi:hypothetical protein